MSLDTDPSPRRTKRRGRHPNKALSAAFVRSAPPGRHADGNGLYLFVQPTGTRSWVQRLVIRGRRRELGLGAATLVPLARAREQALANRMLARSGGDPLSEKRCVQGGPAFAEAAQRVLEQKRGGWRGRWHAKNWWRSMERYVFPRIGSRPVSEVNTADVLEILSPIWHVKAATAREVRQRIRSVLEWAIALDMRNGKYGTEMAMKGYVWSVSALRMKAKREHRVRLCGRAVEILDTARTLGDGSAWCSLCGGDGDVGVDATADAPVPSDRGRGAWLLLVVPGLGGRGDGPSAGGDRGGAGASGAERVEAAYARSDLFERRRRLMHRRAVTRWQSHGRGFGEGGE